MAEGAERGGANEQPTRKASVGRRMDEWLPTCLSNFLGFAPRGVIRAETRASIAGCFRAVCGSGGRSGAPAATSTA